MRTIGLLGAMALTLAAAGCERAPLAPGEAPHTAGVPAAEAQSLTVTLSSSPSTYARPGTYVGLTASVSGGSGSYYYYWHGEADGAPFYIGEGWNMTFTSHTFPHANSVEYMVQVRSGPGGSILGLANHQVWGTP